MQVLHAQLGGTATTDIDTHVFAVIGQSNAIGRSTYTTGATFPAGVQQYNQAGTLESVTGDSALNHVDGLDTALSPMVDFAIDYIAENPGITLVFVPHAEGGTGFVSNDWNKGDTLYENAVTRINAAMSAVSNAEFVGFLWHQGETDAITDVTNYQTDLRTMISDIRSDVTAANEQTPFVLGSFSNTFLGSDTDRLAVNSIVESTPAAITYTAFAEGNDLSIFDSFHFDEASTRTLGSRYFTAWRSALVNTSI
jgi:hypothetical protein